MRRCIDINCDLGEGYNIEAAIMPYVSSVNIACGGHAGNSDTIRSTIQLAKAHRVAVGAHPSYPDKDNFGRVVMKIDIDTLLQSIREQLERIVTIGNEERYPIGHVKLHGALYNEAAKNAWLANSLLHLMAQINSSWVVYGPPNSELQKAAALYQLTYCHEAFIDRTYQDDGSLTPRTHPQALIQNESDSITHALQLICQQQVTALSGKIIPLTAHTLCIHGDGAHAVLFAKALTEELKKQNITIQPAYGIHS